jgi:hypothetical protein
LIAFSNKNFYRSNLIVFPSPYGQGGRLGVRAFYLADAIYENQSNLREAKRVVDAVVEHILTRADESLGVVTLNIKQRDLISELVAERLNSISEAGAYKEHWQEEGEPLFIKTLENVQGYERDAIIISTTFGKPSGSKAVGQNFGPISKQGGWRRLNVLFTRAKKSVTLYTSLRPDDILVGPTTPDGTKALRNYLEYARTGSLTVAEDTGLEPDIEILELAKKSEINEVFLKQKEPNFISNSSFDFENIPIQDFIFCFDVFYHCGINQLKIFLRNVKEISNNKTNIILSLMFANGNPHETQKGAYHYKYASHSNVYYDIDQFIILASQHGFQANLLNKNEKKFFGSRLIFGLKKIIKLN